MKNKTKTMSRNKKRIKIVKKETPSPKKSLLSKKNKSELKDSATARKRSAVARKSGNVEKYRNILENIQEGYFEVDLAGNFTFFNNSVCQALGYSKEELMGMNYRHYTDKEDAKRVFQAYNKVYKKGKPLKEVGWQIARKDGTKRYIEGSISLLKDSSGKPIGFLGITNDVTERKQAEEEKLRESDILFKKLSSNVPGMIYQFLRKPDGTYCVSFSTEAIHDIFGCSPEDVRDDFSPITRFILPEDIDKLIDSIEYSAKHLTHWQCEYRAQIPGKPVKWLLGNSTPEKLADGSVIWHGFNTDITERKRAEERYRNIFENAQEGIYQSTPEGKFIVANQSMARILGYDSPQDLIAGITDIARQVYVDPEERTKFIEMMEQQSLARNCEVQFYRKDGSIIWVSRTMHVVRDEKRQIQYYEGIVEDITDRKASIDRLRNALGGTVRAIASMVETRDPYTAGHQRHVSDLARAIATEIGLSTDRVEGLRVASIIHDIGKLSVPAEILSKPSKLTDIEFSLIKTHAQSGYDILKDIDFPWPVARMVLEHHERMDGSGYPNGLTGNNLLLESRILSVADVVEAMASHRPYRPALGPNKALEEITKNNGTLYDPTVVTACLRLFNEKGYQITD